VVTTVVIGAGISGLAAANVLHKSGQKYVVLERNPNIGYPIRSTGGLALYYVNKFSIPSPPSVIAATIRSVDIRDDYGNHASIEFDHDVGIVYDYPKFIQNLAKDLNVQTGITVSEIAGNDGHRYIVKTTKGEYQADYVISSAGPMSYLSPRSFRVRDEDMIIGYEETRFVDNVYDYDLVLWFTKYAPQGYFWYFPDSNGKKRIGLGVTKQYGPNIKKYFEGFIKLHPELNGDVDHTIAHEINVGPPAKSVTTGNIMYIGETVGTTFATTGGGLQMAYKSGFEAAFEAVTGSHNHYQRVWDREMYPILKRHYKLKQFMYSLNDRQIAKILNTMSGFKVKSENANDEIPRLALYLIRKQPLLFFKLLHSIF